MPKQQPNNYAARAREMVQASQGKQAPRQQPQVRQRREFREAFLFAIIAALFLKTFVIEAYRIPTGSMETTLKVGDFLLVNKFIYSIKTPTSIPFSLIPFLDLKDVRLPHFAIPGMRDPERGDIIVFEYPGGRDELRSEDLVNYIKRCVGTPGDTVEVRLKTLYVNGKEFFHPPGMQFMQPSPEPRGRPDPRIFPLGAPWNHDNFGPLRVPRKGDVIPLSLTNYEQWQVFIMREGHTVSTEHNTVAIDGSPASSYTVQRNYYFMMGDNRDNSEDSRFWGFVPDDNIVGQAMIIYFSWDADIPGSQLGRLLASIRWNRLFHLIF